MVNEGNSFYNKWKSTHGFTAHCKSCDNIVGSGYPDKFEDDDLDRPCPAIKLYICREQQQTSDLYNNVVLQSGSREMANLAIGRLDTMDGGYLGPRTTAATYDMAKKIEELQQKVKAEDNKGECVVCVEHADRGYKCTSCGVFTCVDWFTGHVVANTNVVDYGKLKEAKRKLPCVFKCGAFLNNADIIAFASEEASEQFINSRLELAKMEGREDEKINAEKEKRRLAQLSEEDKRFLCYRKVVTEDILTLKCPRCKFAFFDFDGCYALSCTSCDCSFCAYCLKDCGHDSHSHVANCLENPSKNSSHDVYGNHDFDKVQNQRKLKLIREYLASLPKDEDDDDDDGVA